MGQIRRLAPGAKTGGGGGGRVVLLWMGWGGMGRVGRLWQHQSEDQPMGTPLQSAQHHPHPPRQLAHMADTCQIQTPHLPHKKRLHRHRPPHLRPHLPTPTRLHPQPRLGGGGGEGGGQSGHDGRSEKGASGAGKGTGRGGGPHWGHHQPPRGTLCGRDRAGEKKVFELPEVCRTREVRSGRRL